MDQPGSPLCLHSKTEAAESAPLGCAVLEASKMELPELMMVFMASTPTSYTPHLPTSCCLSTLMAKFNVSGTGQYAPFRGRLSASQARGREASQDGESKNEKQNHTHDKDENKKYNYHNPVNNPRDNHCHPLRVCS